MAQRGVNCNRPPKGISLATWQCRAGVIKTCLTLVETVSEFDRFRTHWWEMARMAAERLRSRDYAVKVGRGKRL